VAPQASSRRRCPFHVENAGIRDMLQDIAIEEFSHLEMVGKLIAQHTSKMD
jgi:Mn-containing catalase